MELLLHLSDTGAEPLHAQITRQIRAKVLARELVGDDALPSIRGLARDQRVSVITVQRAYEDLEREGLLRSHPGKGFFVASMPEGRKKDMAEGRLEDAIAAAVENAEREGLSDAEIRDVVERVLRRGKAKGRGR